MCLIMHFSRLIEQNNHNPGAVCDITVEEEDNKLYRCHVNAWDGMVTVLKHNKNADDSWEEYGHASASHLFWKQETNSSQYLIRYA